MYRRSTQSFIKHLDFLILDALVFAVSLLIGFYLREGRFAFWRGGYYRYVCGILLISHFIVTIVFSSYSGVLRRKAPAEFAAAFTHTAAVITGLLIGLYFYHPDRQLSRLVLIYTSILSFFISFSVRTVYRRILITIGGGAIFGSRVLLIVSDTEGVKRILEKFKKLQIVGYDIRAVVPLDYRFGSHEGVENTGVAADFGGVPVIRGLDGLDEYLRTHVTDEIFFSIPSPTLREQSAISNAAAMGVTVHLETFTGSYLRGEKVAENIAGMQVLTSSMRLVSPRDAFIKRVLDMLGGIIGSLITCVLMIIIGPLIYLSDPGPIIFKQDRVGRNGRIFKMYKFRSMYMDAEERKKELMAENEMSGHMFKIENDPRILGSGPDGKKHGIGWFIRKTSIDEFPQFFNVLKGEMSMVGTRPPTVDEFREYETRQYARLAVRPGITGMWQVSGRSRVRDFDEVVRLDLAYIDNWSLWLDITIILKTIFVVLSGQGAK